VQIRQRNSGALSAGMPRLLLEGKAWTKEQSGNGKLEHEYLSGDHEGVKITFWKRGTFSTCEPSAEEKSSKDAQRILDEVQVSSRVWQIKVHISVLA
jgi:hypothetical protein